MAIHHPRAVGAHQVEPMAGFWCLRWWRDSHRTITPSGRTRSTNVAGAPTLSMWPLRFRVVMTASHPWRSDHHPAPGLVLLAIGAPTKIRAADACSFLGRERALTAALPNLEDRQRAAPRP